MQRREEAELREKLLNAKVGAAACCILIYMRLRFFVGDIFLSKLFWVLLL